MRERIIELWRVLNDTGSLYLHCDWHAASYLKVMLDEVCGSSHFQNDVIWHYRGGGVSKKRFGRRHDIIFFYTKGDDWTFNVDEIRTAYSQESLDRLKYKARSFRKTTSGEKIYDNYEANTLGKHPDDVLDIQPTMPSSKERLGYPTQKPERLLEVFIKASSNPGDIVLDPFAGCGTALSVAHRLNRKWVGIDISPTACNLIFQRLTKAGAFNIEMFGMPTTPEDLRKLKPFEFQNWIINNIHGVQTDRKSGDMGIDGWTFLVHDPVQIKQSESVGRNVVDNFETAVSRARKKKGFIIAFSFTRGAYEEATRAKKRGLEIQLFTVPQLLAQNEQIHKLGLRPYVRTPLDLPYPEYNSSRHTVEELIASDRQQLSLPIGKASGAAE